LTTADRKKARLKRVRRTPNKQSACAVRVPLARDHNGVLELLFLKLLWFDSEIRVVRLLYDFTQNRAEVGVNVRRMPIDYLRPDRSVHFAGLFPKVMIGLAPRLAEFTAKRQEAAWPFAEGGRRSTHDLFLWGSRAIVDTSS